MTPESMVIPPNTPEELRAAALVVAANAIDGEDCAELLDMLGLQAVRS